LLPNGSFDAIQEKHFGEPAMKLTTFALFALAGIGAGLMATSAFAGAGDDAVKGRQACMKSHGASFGVFMPMMKGEKPFDKAAVAAAFAAEDAACADWDKFWAAGAEKGETLQTWAKPEIWTDRKGFEAAGGAWYEAAQAVKGAADEASFKAAIPKMGAGCQGCHEKYRLPKG
jgi:cytochrome c556